MTGHDDQSSAIASYFTHNVYHEDCRMNIKKEYEQRQELVAIGNYVESRDKELEGKYITWCDPRNDGIERGLNESIATYNEMKSKGEI